MGPEKSYAQKHFGKENFWVRKKYFGQKKNLIQNLHIQKNLSKNLGPKKLRSQKILGSKILKIKNN